MKMTGESLAQAVVLENREIVTGHFLMVLKVPSLFGDSRPGQFVMMRLPGRETPFLGRPFSIHAVYSRGCLPHVEGLLEQGRMQINGLFELVRVRYLGDDEIDRFDPKHLSFFNVNTEADLAEAQRLAREI